MSKTKNRYEVRNLPLQEVRVAPLAGDGTRLLTGRAIVYGVRSQDLGGFQEIVSASALSQTLGDGTNKLLLNNHNTSQVLGSTRSGTLQLTSDSKGLNVSCKVDTRQSYANDLLISIERGDTAGMSFGFRTLRDNYTSEKGVLIRTLESIELFEASVTPSPAYLQTQVDLRSCPTELRSMLKRSFDEEDDDECTCERDEFGNLINPDCDCDDEEDDDDEDRASWAEMTLLRLEVARRK